MFAEMMMVIGAGLAGALLSQLLTPRHRRRGSWQDRTAALALVLAVWVMVVAGWGAWSLGRAGLEALAAAGEQEAAAQQQLGQLYSLQTRISNEAFRRQEIQASAGGPAGPWAEDMPGFVWVQEAIAASEIGSPEARAQLGSPEKVAAELVRLDRLYP